MAQIAYDAMHRPVAALDKEGHAVATHYDLNGQVRTVADPNGSRSAANTTARKGMVGPSRPSTP